MKFGEKVRKARLAAHFSQQQLADRTGISLRTIQNYESVEEITGLYAGGERVDEDMDAMMQAIQEAYWLAKKRRRTARAFPPV